MLKSKALKIRHLRTLVYILMFLGMWPCWKNSTMQKIHTYFIILFQGFNCMSILGGFSNCENVLSCYVENMSYFMVHFLGFYCALVMHVKHKETKLCLYKLHKFIEAWEFNSFVQKAEKYANLYVTFMVTYTIGGTVLYNTAPMFMYYDCMTVLEKAAAPCGLPISESLPVNINKSPQYELVYVFLYAGGFLGIMSLISASLFPFVITIYVTAHLDYLKHDLLEIKSNNSCHLNYKILKKCVLHHIDLTTFVMVVQKIFGSLILVTFATMSLNLTIYIFEFMYFFVNIANFWPLAKCSMLLCGYSVALFTFCTLGQICKASNEDLMRIIYDVPWYNESAKFKYLMKFMLKRAQKPLTLAVKGMGYVDNELMSSVLKTTYSYSTVLMNLVFRKTT